MRLPRDWSDEELIRRLGRLGYEPTRQTGSHVRLTRRSEDSEHHITVPVHHTLRIGTLNNIHDVAVHLDITKEELLRRLL